MTVIDLNGTWAKNQGFRVHLFRKKTEKVPIIWKNTYPFFQMFRQKNWYICYFSLIRYVEKVQ